MEKHIHVINKDKLDKIEMLDDNLSIKMSLLFKSFGDKTRLKIMNVLLDNKLNVCEISSLLNMTHSAISHQLSYLKMANLVNCEKNGKEVYYFLADDCIYSMLRIGKNHSMGK